MKHLTRAAVLLFGIALAAVHPSGPATADVVGLNVVAPEKEFPRRWRSYPSMNKVFERPGVARSVTQVRRVAIGSSKTQLVRSVGQPVSAYNDGSWNFNVALRLPQRNRLICQYRVFFDSQDRVAGTAWRRPQCADIIAGRRN